MSSRIGFFQIAISFLIAASCQSTFAKANGQVRSALRDLEMSCLKNQSEPRTKKWSGSCFCLTNTLQRELSEVPSARAFKEVQWAKKVFDGTLPKDEFSRDPLNLVDSLDEILNRCASSQATK